MITRITFKIKNKPKSHETQTKMKIICLLYERIRKETSLVQPLEKE